MNEFLAQKIKLANLDWFFYVDNMNQSFANETQINKSWLNC